MKTTKKQLKEISKVEKIVSKVCETNDGIIDKTTGIVYPKKPLNTLKNIKLEKDIDGTIFNKETGEPIIQQRDIDILKEIMYDKKNRDISISLIFGKAEPYLSLKEQIKEQGFKISKGFITDAEKIRKEIHGLNEAGILNSKQLFKCFKKLSKVISKKIVESQIKDGEVAIHKKTFLIK